MPIGSQPDERVDTAFSDLAMPIFDGHNDLPWALRQQAAEGRQVDLTVEQSALGMHTDLPRLRKGGVAAQFWSVYVPASLKGSDAVQATIEQIEIVHDLVARYADSLALALNADGVERARSSGRLASLLGAEGGHCINESLSVLRAFHRLGVRYLTLTHNDNVPWADSATDVRRLGGLSDFGVEVVAECNRLGILVDLSHTSPATMHATLDVTAAPAFFSHSCARALCDHPRNVPDDVLERVAATDGVVMVAFVPPFLTEECRAWSLRLQAYRREFLATLPEDGPAWRALEREWMVQNPPPRTTIADVADHIEHVREVAGIDHVGLGADFDGVAVLPQDVTGVDAYPRLLDELSSRAWSRADLSKLAWHNALRVLRDTEACSEDAGRDGGSPRPPGPYG